MRVLHVVPHVNDPAMGPSYSVPSLCGALAELPLEVELHTLAPVTLPADVTYATRGYPRARFPYRLARSRPMLRGLREAARNADVMHTSGLWVMPSVYPARAVRGTNCRLVTSPRGMLDAWAIRHHGIRKQLVWRIAQRRCLEAAACLHATVEQECNYIRDMGLGNPVTVVPNGIDVPAEDRPRPRPGGRRRLLFLARIHPKKGVDRLLHAWRNVQAAFPDWELYVVGPDQRGYLGQMRSLAHSLGLERATLTGRIPQSEKPMMFDSAELYVLPTFTENWGVSVAEALSHGLPAIVTHGAPWGGLEEHGCGWWIDNSVDSLTGCLEQALASSPEDLRVMGARGRAWMKREYSWERVGRMMYETYLWLTDRGPRPRFVRVD